MCVCVRERERAEILKRVRSLFNGDKTPPNLEILFFQFNSDELEKLIRETTMVGSSLREAG